MWLTYALLSAVFAALTAILAKIGVANINSNLATAIRTTVILGFAWMIVWFQGGKIRWERIDEKTWVFLVLSGLATGLSWLFYFRALQIGEASKVAPIDKLSLVMTVVLAAIIFKEKLTMLGWVGVVLMTVGATLIGIAS